MISMPTNEMLQALPRLTRKLTAAPGVPQAVSTFMGWLEETVQPGRAALFLAETSFRELRLVKELGFPCTNESRLGAGEDPWKWLEKQGVTLPQAELSSRMAFDISLDDRLLGKLVLTDGHLGENRVAEQAVLESAITFLALTLRHLEGDRSTSPEGGKGAEESRPASGLDYRGLVENSQDLICTHDLDGTLLSVNEVVTLLTGFEKSEIIGTNLVNILHPKARPALKEYLNTILANGFASGLMKIRIRSGETRVWEYNNKLLKTEEGKPFVHGVARDVTERVRAEKELRQKKEDLALINALNEAFLEGHGVQAIGDLLSGELEKRFRAFGGAIYLLSEDKQTLHITNYGVSPDVLKKIEALIRWPIPDLQLALSRTVKFKEFIQSRTAHILTSEEMHLVFLDFVETSLLPQERRTLAKKNLPRIERMLDVNTGLFFPLINEGEVFGLFQVTSHYPISDRDRKRLETISKQLTGLLQRERVEEERQRLTTELETRNQMLLAIHDIGKILSATLDVHEIYHLIWEEIARKLLASTGFIVGRFHPQTEMIICDYAIVEGQEVEPSVFPSMLVEKEGPLSELLQGRQPVVVDLADRGPGGEAETWLNVVDEGRCSRSVMYIPLISRDQLIGMMIFQSPKPQAYQSIDLVVLATLASQASVALHNAELFSQLANRLDEIETAESMLKRQLDELTVLHEVAKVGVKATREDDLLDQVTQIIAQALYPDHFGVLLLDEPDRVLKAHPSYRGIADDIKEALCIPLGKGVSGRVAETGKALLIPDVARETEYLELTPQTRSELCVPIKISEKILGVINAESSEANAFTVADEQLLSTLASQMAAGLENIRIYQRERNRSAMMAGFLDLSIEMAAIQDESELLRTFVNRAIALGDSETCSVLLVDESRGEAVVVAQTGFLEGTPAGLRIPLDFPILKGCLRSGSPLVLSDIDRQAPELQALLVRPDVKALYIFPFTREGKVQGAFTLSKAQVHALSQQGVAAFSMLAERLAAALENVRLLKAERRRLVHQTSLNAIISASSATSLGLKDLLGTALDQVLSAMGLDTGAIWTRPGSGIPEIRVLRNLPDSLSYNRAAAKAGLDIESPQVVQDWESESRLFKEKILALGIRASLTVPILAQNERIGGISVAGAQPRVWDQEEIALLEAVGQQLGMVVERAWLFNELQQQADQTNALLESTRALTTLDLDTMLETITGQAKALFQADGSWIHLLEPDGVTLRCATVLHDNPREIQSFPLKLGEGLTGQVAASGVAEVIPNAASDPRSRGVPETPDDPETLMLAPLKDRDRVIGVMSVSRKGVETPFQAHQLDFLKAFASQVSVAIANARAFEAIQDRARELEILRATGLRIATSSNLRATLNPILEAALRLVGADDAHVFIFEEGQLSFGAAQNQEGVLDSPLAAPRPKGVTSRVAHSGVRMIIPDTSRHPIYEGYGWKGALVSLPLWVNNQVIGVMNVAYEQPHRFDEHELRALDLLMEQAAMALANILLLEETSRQAREMSVLAQAMQSLTTTLEPDTLLQNILEAAYRAIPAAEKGALILLDKEDTLRVRAVVGYEDPRVQHLTFPITWGYTGKAVREKQPLLIPDVQADADLRVDSADAEIPEVAEVLSSIVAPLIVKGKVIGAMALDNASTPNAFGERDVELLTSFASQAAMAIANARLYAETNQHLIEMEAVSRVSTALREAENVDAMLPILLNETLAVMGSNAGSILLFDPETRQLNQSVARGWFTALKSISLRSDRGMAGHVFASGEVYRTHEFATDPLTDPLSKEHIPAGWGGVCVPLRVAREIIGVFSISTKLPDELNDESVRLLCTLAEIAGNAIHRSTLHEQTRRQLEYLTSLRSVEKAISSSLDLKLTLEIVLSQLTTQLRVDAADVLLRDPQLISLELKASRGLQVVSQKYKRLNMDECLAGRAAKERRLVHESDLENAGDFSRVQMLCREGFLNYFGVPLITKGVVLGVLEIFHRKRFHPDNEWVGFLESIAAQTAIAIDNAKLFESLQRTNLELAMAYDATIEGWAKALELRDEDTEGHTQRVADLTEKLAHGLGIQNGELVHIRRGALLHDIGKVAIPDAILRKPGPLSIEEWEVMKQHPRYAFEMLAPITYLKPALEIPFSHHEKWNGSGYPQGLQGERIPLAARIFAVADVWDALISDRPYRKAWSREKALAFIKEQSGIHFDPRVVKVFLEIV